MPSTAPRSAYIALIWISIVWGSTYLALRIGVQDGLPGLYLAAIRQSIAGIILVAFFWLRGAARPQGWRDWRNTITPGLFLLLLSNGAMTWAMQYIHSGLGSIVGATGPLVMALLSAWLLRQRLTWRVFLGLSLGAAGILVIFSDYWAELLNPAFAFGIALAFFAVLTWTSGSILAIRWQSSISSTHVAAWQMLSSGLILFPICWLSGQHAPLASISLDAWWAILYLIVIGSLISYSAYTYCLQHLPPSLISLHAYINPVVALLLGWLVLSEKLSSHIVLGSAIVLTGVYLVNQALKKAKKAETLAQMAAAALEAKTAQTEEKTEAEMPA